jgi:hypothetical protein
MHTLLGHVGDLVDPPFFLFSTLMHRRLAAGDGAALAPRGGVDDYGFLPATTT